ncbi:hypothetical protein Hs30E_12480 [Lactococcus hodotermopsidis]|uniref:Uncharacterized protein n=2 Tax=Pseudolactococcus hodotermopsidis TaxID=2709157 RepID=A0A6A0BFT7_9LACT|nr:hypothetical protein Hs30E_12480 [Lactococcus hodotermopsidis]
MGSLIIKDYLSDRKVDKIETIGTVVEKDKHFLLAYTFSGKKYESIPVDILSLKKSAHNVGDQKKIYINSDKPYEIFLKENVRGELAIGCRMIGWSLLLMSILFFEYWLINRMKEFSKARH